jgi:hypothetical protein
VDSVPCSLYEIHTQLSRLDTNLVPSLKLRCLRAIEVFKLPGRYEAHGYLEFAPRFFYLSLSGTFLRQSLTAFVTGPDFVVLLIVLSKGRGVVDIAERN